MNSVNEGQDKGNGMISTENKQPPVSGFPQYFFGVGLFII
jgi:hypothetical protein